MKRKTNEQFIKDIKSKVGEEYTILSPYVNSRTTVKIVHNECGNIYEITPNSFLSGRRCSKCNGNEAKRKTTDLFKKEVYSLVKDEYIVIGNYVNRAKNITIKHNKCGRVYKVQPGNFLSGSRCIECYYESIRSKNEEIDRRIKSALGADYTFLKRVDKRLALVYHNKCNKEFVGNMSDLFLGKTSCKNCSGSIGESLVREYLLANGYKFKEQVKFEGLKDITSLTYDFYIESKDVLLEYQGVKHYKPTSFGSTNPKNRPEVRFSTQLDHDKKKRDYALSNGLKLIEIPYTKNNKTKISLFLDSYLK